MANIHVTYIEHNGTKRVIEASIGATLMETAVKNNVPGIVAECGGACSCATCHVYVEEAWVNRVGEKSSTENDMLDFATDLRPNSRLSCQIKLDALMDGLVVHTPKKQG